MKKMFYPLMAFLCLLIGAAVYMAFNPSAFFIRAVFPPQTITGLSKKLKMVFPDTGFTRYHLADILWYQSLLFIVYYVYHIKKLFHTGIIYYFTLSLPFLLEILQGLKMIRGTYDQADIFFYAIILFLNYLFILWKKNEK